MISYLAIQKLGNLKI